MARQLDFSGTLLDSKRSPAGAETPNRTPKHVRRIDAERPAEIVNPILLAARPLLEADMKKSQTADSILTEKQRRAEQSDRLAEIINRFHVIGLAVDGIASESRHSRIDQDRTAAVSSAMYHAIEDLKALEQAVR